MELAYLTVQLIAAIIILIASVLDLITTLGVASKKKRRK